jgi:mycobactin lysine-N-oxygenase
VPKNATCHHRRSSRRPDHRYSGAAGRGATVNPATVVVVGAGPKAVAIAAKAKVLRELERPAPEIVVIEEDSIAARWRSSGGYTNGKRRLGTPPEKDVGFPYRSHKEWGAGRDVDGLMLAYGWTSYLIDRGRFHQWVDAGRPRPRHEEWADYLSWAARQAGLVPLAGRVSSIDLAGSRWTVQVEPQDGRRYLVAADGVVVTGVGRRAGLAPSDSERYTDTFGFWRAAARGAVPPGKRAIVIGAGEASADVACALGGTLGYSVTIVAPRAALFSRGESTFENTYFSRPKDWHTLSEPDRREFISRCDRGVFSPAALEALASFDSVSFIPGRVHAVKDGSESVAVSAVYDGRTEIVEADLVVDASGSDAMWWTALLGPEARAALRRCLGEPVVQAAVERAIGPALEVAGLTPRLHLPSLSGVAQGPGFPGLSCLGLLSDRILTPYAAAAG